METSLLASTGYTPPFDGSSGAHAYLALTIGALLEGEASVFLITAVLGQSRIHLTTAVLAASLGAFLGDLICFGTGSVFGMRLLAWRPTLRERTLSIQNAFDHYYTPAVLSVRFMYGLRTPALLAMGMGRVGMLRFCFLDAIAAMLWGTIVVCAGHFSGQAFIHPDGTIDIRSVAIGCGCMTAVILLLWLVSSKLSARLKSRSIAN